MGTKCKAQTKSGRPCSKDAIDGGTVCYFHGGNAPQVIAAARRRLATMMFPALAVVEKSLKKHKSNPGVALRAAMDVLDRNGFKAPEKHEITGEGGAAIDVNVSARDSLISRIAELVAVKRTGEVSREPDGSGSEDPTP
jgi:hypothetical protein